MCGAECDCEWECEHESECERDTYIISSNMHVYIILLFMSRYMYVLCIVVSSTGMPDARPVCGLCRGRHQDQFCLLLCPVAPPTSPAPTFQSTWRHPPPQYLTYKLNKSEFIFCEVKLIEGGIQPTHLLYPRRWARFASKLRILASLKGVSL